MPEPVKSAALSGSAMLVQSLKREGVEVIFTLNGGHIAPIFDACLDEGIRLLDVRHEEAAGHMAHAFARITGRLAVAVVSAGPGVTNIVTAVANAWQAGCPMLVVGGKAPLKQFELGALQDIPQAEIMAPITKWSRTVLETPRIPEYVRMACREALSGRPGPVYLEVPTDVLRGQAPCGRIHPDGHATTQSRPCADPAAIEAALDLLAAAQRPVIVAGGGIIWSRASEALCRFADATGIPVITTSAAKGCVPYDHPQHMPAARSLALSRADVVLVIGTRLNFVLGYGRPPRFDPGARFIQVDIDPAGIGRNRPVEVGIPADAQMALQQFIAAASGRFPSRRSPWLDELAAKNGAAQAKLRALSDSNALPIHPWRLCGEIRRFLDEDAIIVADGGDILSFARVAISTNYPSHWLEPGAFGCLGVGVPFAVAAKLAKPSKQVLCLTGDGAFGLTGVEIDTAVRHKIPIVVVISNNAGWGIERTSQARDYGVDRVIGTDLLPTRYDLVAKALGGHGELVEQPADIRPALERAFASGLPACINVRTDPSAESPDSARGLARVPDEQAIAYA